MLATSTATHSVTSRLSHVASSGRDFKRVSMDQTLARLSTYTSSLAYDDLPAETRHQAKRLWVDTIGCAIGALNEPPIEMARALATGATGDRVAPVVGGGTANVEWATFVNGILMRYLDYNDFYQAPGMVTGGHPSDTLAPGLALSAMAGCDGTVLILAAVLGWEIYARTSDAVASRALDQALYAAIASACVAAKVLDLSEEATANAISIAAVANVSVLQSRYGEMSMWKSCAVPYGCKNGVEAALMARLGMTAPDEPFEGGFGVFKVSTGSAELLRPFGGGDVPFQIHRSSTKYFPIGSLAQTAIECALLIRRQLKSPDDISEVNIETVRQAVALMASPDRWHPTIRETADHSLPYGVALALLYGGVELGYFSPEYMQKQEVAGMLNKIKVVVSEELDALYPEQRTSVVEIVTHSGERFVEKKGYHRGHPNDPMSDDEIESKFRSLVEPHLGRTKADQLLSLLWNLENVVDVRQIVELTSP
jgi:2-methylcitrate dehydratase